jgi:hypothetical protein
MLFNFALKCGIWRVQANPEGWKLNGMHQHLVHAAGIYILSGNIHTANKNTEALLFVSKETDREVNADRSMYMVMPREKNAGQNKNIKTGNKSF